MTVDQGRKKVPPIVPKKKVGLTATPVKKSNPPAVVAPKPHLSATKASATHGSAPQAAARAGPAHKPPRSLADFMNSLSLEPKAQPSGHRGSQCHGTLGGKATDRPKPALKPKPQLDITKAAPIVTAKAPAAVLVSSIPESAPLSINQFTNKNGQVMIALPGLVNKHATDFSVSSLFRASDTAVRQTRRASTSALTSTADLNQTPQKLRHLNKGRSKGPKRSQKKAKEKAPASKHVHAQNEKRPPPPPKKPLFLAANPNR